MNIIYFRCLTYISAILMVSINIIFPQTSQLETADKFFQKQDWKKAAEIYEQIVKEDSANNNAWYRLAYAYHNLREYDKAINVLNRIADNENPAVLYNLACSYSMAGRKEKALLYLDKAVKAGFNQISQITADTDLNNIKQEERFNEIISQIKTCDNQPEHRQFDFWVGEWEVFNRQGQKTGNSVIQKILKNCVILENWTGATGYTGKSFNYYDSEKSKWQQFWIDEKVETISFEGNYSDSTMVFFSYDHEKDENRYIRRLRFFNMGQDSVRQFSERSSDEGKTWIVEYDFIYKRIK